MQLDDLKNKKLEIANNQYPEVALIEIENNKVVSLPKYDIEDIAIALKELQDNGFLVNAITKGVDQIISFGHLEVTAKGRNLFKK